LVVVEVLSVERRPEGMGAGVVRDAVKDLVPTEVAVGIVCDIDRNPLDKVALDPCTYRLVLSLEDASSGAGLVAKLAVVKNEGKLLRVDIRDLVGFGVLDLPLLVVLSLGQVETYFVRSHLNVISLGMMLITS